MGDYQKFKEICEEKISGDTTAALSCLQDMFRIYPEDLWVSQALGYVLIRLGREDATEFLSLAVKKHHDARLTFNLGVAFQRKKKYVEALRHFKESTLIDPSYYEAHIALSTLQFRLLMPIQSSRTLLQAIRIRLDNSHT